MYRIGLRKPRKVKLLQYRALIDNIYRLLKLIINDKMTIEILVPAIASFIAFVMGLSFKFFYSFIKDKREDISKKLKQDFLREIDFFNRRKIKEKELVKRLILNSKFQNMVENSDKLLEKNMFLTGIILILISFTYAIFPSIITFAVIFYPALLCFVYFSSCLFMNYTKSKKL